MSSADENLRYKAVSMLLAADLDRQSVEMRIATSAGQLVSIVCDRDAIFKIQQHIAALAEECPETTTWR